MNRRWLGFSIVGLASAAIAGIVYSQRASSGAGAAVSPVAAASISAVSVAAAAAPAALAAPRVSLRPANPYGIVVTTTETWGQERSFLNLAMTGHWFSARADGWHDFDLARIGRGGAIMSLQPNEKGVLSLAAPPTSYDRDVPIRCTYSGTGDVTVFNGRLQGSGAGRLDFMWKKGEAASILISRTAAADPVRAFDCREASASRTALFDPQFVQSIRPYSVVRFLDWQRANENKGGDWNRRNLPTTIPQFGDDGIAVEHMVALANEAGTSPWFVMPWNASDEYLRNFAIYVRDHLNKTLPVYVEAGNEVWNFNFPVAQQALREGQSMGLSPDANTARMRRYAQRSNETFAIFTKVFAGQNNRLVRVLSGQSPWPELIQYALEYGDTAKNVDALAIAPYFGGDLFADASAQTAGPTALFAQLNKYVDKSIDDIRRNKLLADRFGLRLIAYEAGQHIVNGGSNKTIVGQLNRDPRMKAVYQRYLAAWKKENGDLIMMFASVSPINAGSAWGLAERSGQPLSETPKRQAVLEAIAAGAR